MRSERRRSEGRPGRKDGGEDGGEDGVINDRKVGRKGGNELVLNPIKAVDASTPI